jgi:hypothetical protein
MRPPSAALAAGSSLLCARASELMRHCACVVQNALGDRGPTEGLEHCHLPVACAHAVDASQPSLSCTLSGLCHGPALRNGPAVQHCAYLANITAPAAALRDLLAGALSVSDQQADSESDSPSGI